MPIWEEFSSEASQRQLPGLGLRRRQCRCLASRESLLRLRHLRSTTRRHCLDRIRRLR